ncbi:RNA 2',3'-cyclic phosphodiesterase [Pontibacter sp. SGAir0037]|uniref:RNA 2',3'-cyclic phosphodiesterase n=1 Tax=Pontibacter sp. SGAir0037 TaxID=2571030 RepID=UPI0010CD2031|nr:RNA 2',3'-cyclic phosphodiesterase [Pontibacter sp. SGAir0037]QCR23242.1 RNA 2',3'-cyclic phosphodiesterase [Pontibacter sp. SGAir0037]
MRDEIRLFVAATLPAQAKEFLMQRLSPFHHPAVRVIPEQNLHLTLFFIGNVSKEQLPAIRHKIEQVAQQHTAFTLELEQLEPGPKFRSPRLVWARFKPDATFEQLSTALTQALAKAPPKQQKAIPHVTLARFRKDKPVPANLPHIIPDELLQLPVNTVALWQSELASPHPVYSVLESYPLKPNL